MKIKVLREMERDGRIYKKGDTIDLPKNNADVWVARLWGEYITKEKKVKKETKENKSSKETK